MKLKISILNHFRVLSFHLMGTIFMIVSLYFLAFDVGFVLAFGSWYVFLTVPSVFLHLQYYFANRNMEVQINSEELTIIRKNLNVERFRIADFTKIILYKSASIDKGGIQLSPIESYHYLRIIAKSERQIIITCLMHPKLDSVIASLNGVPKLRKKRLFCDLIRE